MVLDEILNQLYVASVFVFRDIRYDLSINSLAPSTTKGSSILTPGRSINDKSAESGPELLGEAECEVRIPL